MTVSACFASLAQPRRMRGVLGGLGGALLLLSASAAAQDPMTIDARRYSLEELQQMQARQQEAAVAYDAALTKTISQVDQTAKQAGEISDQTFMAAYQGLDRLSAMPGWDDRHAELYERARTIVRKLKPFYPVDLTLLYIGEILKRPATPNILPQLKLIAEADKVVEQYLPADHILRGYMAFLALQFQWMPDSPASQSAGAERAAQIDKAYERLITARNIYRKTGEQADGKLRELIMFVKTHGRLAIDDRIYRALLDDAKRLNVPYFQEGEPIVRVEADYPSKPLEDAVEGHVALKFRVDENGIPQDIQVTESEPKDIFDASAIDAVRQWRYRPERNVKGEPVARENIETRIEYTISK